MASTGHHASPLERLLDLLQFERNDVTVVVAYTVMTTLLMLIVPLASQALVNTIAAGVFIQPLVVLTSLTLLLLLLAGGLRLMQFSIIERLQQRLFARVALQLADHMPHVETRAFLQHYGPEQYNRFFDVLTIQKNFAKFLMDGPAAVLQVIIGLILLAFYNPYFIVFDLVVVLYFLFSIRVLGHKGLRSSIVESICKYRVVAWLQDLARNHFSLKRNSHDDFAFHHTDAYVLSYVDARKTHFGIVFRQAIGNYLFYAFASATILGLGGWLVIERQFSLGQLVASEIIVVSVLAAIEKLFSMYEAGYDLLTALDKVGHLTDMPIEENKGRYTLPDKGLPSAALGAPFAGQITEPVKGLSVTLNHTSFAYRPRQAAVISPISLTIPAGQRVAIIGQTGSGKSTLLHLIGGSVQPAFGSVFIGDLDVRDIDNNSLRQNISWVSDTPDILMASLEDNIRMGRSWIPYSDITWAMTLCGLDNATDELPQGLKTELSSTGYQLSRGTVQRILLARAVANRPRLLLLDEAFVGLDGALRHQLCQNLFDPQHPWTLIVVTHLRDVLKRADRVLVFHDGQIVKDNLWDDMAQSPVVQTLFPGESL
jgi:ABC-type bacteriocin/lantibiotic exporter with double-glycine peptidase domain